MLLYEGRQIYFGPVDAAVSYFTALGFVKPQRVTTPDFLTSLTNPAERVVAKGLEARVPKSPDDFASAWDRSPEASAIRAEIDAPGSPAGSGGHGRPDETRLGPKDSQYSPMCLSDPWSRLIRTAGPSHPLTLFPSARRSASAPRELYRGCEMIPPQLSPPSSPIPSSGSSSGACSMTLAGPRTIYSHERSYCSLL